MTELSRIPTPPVFTPEELEYAFTGKTYLWWLRDKVVANAPLTKLDEIHLWLVYSRVADFVGRLDDAMSAVDNAEKLTTTYEPSAIGHVFVHRAFIKTRQGQYAQAEELATAAIPLLIDHPDLILCHTTLGQCALESNRFELAEYHHLLAAENSRRHNYLNGLAISLHNLAHINLWRGRFDLCLRFAREADEIQLAEGTTRITYPLHAVQIFQIRNQRAEAEEALDSLAHIAAQMSLFAASVAICAARLHLDAEEFEAAHTEAERAYSLAVRVGIPVFDVFSRTVNSRLQRMMGNPTAAIEWAQDALMYARRVGYGYLQAHALIEEGAAHRENNNVKAAATCWCEAMRISEALGAHHELAHALLLLACLYHDSEHAEADTLWQRAATAILEHGYTFLLERERILAFPLVAAYARRQEAQLRQPAEQLLGRLVNVAALPLHVRGLGEFAIRRGAQRIDAKALQRRRAGELLRYLLIQPNQRAARDLIIEALWPDQSPGKGQDLLHQATSTLRRALEPDLPDKFPSRYLKFEGEQISLNLPTGSTVDFFEFAELAQQATAIVDLDAALAHYLGDLFPEDRYADWAEARREELIHLYQQTMLRRAQEHLRTGNAHAALSDCRVLLQRDPCQEDATLIAMQASTMLGDRPAALRFYHKVEQALEREFQLVPRSDLMHFAANLRRRNPSA